MSPRDAHDYPRPAVAVDLVVLTLVDAVLHVLLVRRGEAPFKGRWALPGGFVRVGEDDPGEDLGAAAARELEEETGLPAKSMYLEQLTAFGAARRDPRMRVITIAYFALVRPDLVPFVKAGGDAEKARFWPLDEWQPGRAKTAAPPLVGMAGDERFASGEVPARSEPGIFMQWGVLMLGVRAEQKTDCGSFVLTAGRPLDGNLLGALAPGHLVLLTDVRGYPLAASAGRPEAELLLGQARIVDGERPDDPADFARRIDGLLLALLNPPDREGPAEQKDPEP